MGDTKKVLSYSPVGEFMGGAEKAKALPGAPAPVTKEDPNVKAAAMMKKRRLSQSSRAGAQRLLASQSGSTLG